ILADPQAVRVRCKWEGKHSATTDSGGADGIREVRAEVEAGAVSGRDGAEHPVGGVTSVDRTTLSKGREWAAAGGVVDHAAGVLFAAVVQPVGSGRGRGAVRIARAAALCGGGLGTRAGTRREHDFAVSSFVGETRSGRSHVANGK